MDDGRSLLGTLTRLASATEVARPAPRLRRVLASALAFALVFVGCSEQIAPQHSHLRDVVVAAGPHGARRVLEILEFEDTSSSVLNDRDFLIDLWLGRTQDPDWLSGSGSSYATIRSMAGVQLARGHHNRTFTVPDAVLVSIGELARRRLQDTGEDNVATLDAITTLGMIGDPSDIPLLEERALDTEDNWVLQKLLIALAISCDDQASTSIDRIAIARNQDLTKEFVADVRRTRMIKLGGLCATSQPGRKN